MQFMLFGIMPCPCALPYSGIIALSRHRLNCESNFEKNAVLACAQPVACLRAMKCAVLLSRHPLPLLRCYMYAVNLDGGLCSGGSCLRSVSRFWRRAELSLSHVLPQIDT